jgi:hypothetical protein
MARGKKAVKTAVNGDSASVETDSDAKVPTYWDRPIYVKDGFFRHDVPDLDHPDVYAIWEEVAKKSPIARVFIAWYIWRATWTPRKDPLVLTPEQQEFWKPELQYFKSLKDIDCLSILDLSLASIQSSLFNDVWSPR